MSAFKDTRHHTGYDQEETYFHKVNRDLIQKAKEKRHLTLVKNDEPVPTLPVPKPEPKQKK